MVVNSRCPTSDPRWADASEPLHLFLRVPRSWPDILAWAKQVKVDGSLLRNMLAWLEGAGKARSFETTRVMWVGGGYVRASEEDVGRAATPTGHVKPASHDVVGQPSGNGQTSVSKGRRSVRGRPAQHPRQDTKRVATR